MKRASITLILSSLLSGLATGEVPVYFADPDLKAAVEARLSISDPTPSDMLGLTQLLCIANDVTDLTGLGYAANLRELNLRLNDIGGLSPLSGLSNLETLYITMCNISDLSPLSGLGNLTYLNVHGNQISDLSPVSGLAKLETLVIHRNLVSDISAVSGLSNLRHLDCQRNPISDLSPVSGLANLATLLLEYNQVSDISPLASFTSLRELDLRENPLNDEAYDIYIPQIMADNPGISLKYNPRFEGRIVISSGRGGRVTDPGEGEFFYKGVDWVLVKAQADPGFMFVGWTGTYSTTNNPAMIAMNQEHEIQANFQSLLYALYVDDDAPTDPGPGDRYVSDPSEDGTLEHPFDGIQEAIEVAGEGASVFVDSGTYRGDIDFRGKNIRLIGMDPNDPGRGSWPVIEGTVRLDYGSDATCVLMGFIITGGKGRPAGAIYCNGASPTITNCLIVGNRTTDPNGAAIYCEDSKAVLMNCTIADNYAGRQGAGLTLVDSDVTVLNSILWDNLPQEILSTGTSTPDIRYCTVRGWWPDWGNIHKNPLFARPGSWADPDDPKKTLPPENARAVWVEGDYHLRSQAGRWDPQKQGWVLDEATSPAIDGGLSISPAGHEPAPNGGRVNMGVYGGTAQASKSHLEVIAP